MIKLIDYIKKYKSKKNIDPFQKKSFLNILRFFTIMIMLTLIARGTAGAIMPKISLTKVTAETIIDKIELVGQLELSNHMPIETHPNIKINDILVEVGEKIEIGDSLFEYDKNEVDILVKKESAEINKLQIQYNQLLKSETVDTDGVINATDSLAYALEDQANSVSNSDNTIAKANKEIQDAKNQLSDSEEQYNKDTKSKENANNELSEAIKALETLESLPAVDQASIDAATLKVTETKAQFVLLENQAKTDLEAIDTKKTILTDLENELIKLQTDEPDNATAIKAAQDSVDAAKQALQILEKQFALDQEEIIKKETELTEAESTLNSLLTLSSDLAKAQQRVDKTRATVAEYDGKQQNSERLIKQTKDMVEGTTEGLNDAQNSANQEATLQDRGVTNAHKTLDSANKSYLQSQEQIKDTQELNVADATILSIALEEKKQMLQELQQIQEANYLLLSTQKGVLLNWNIKEREPSIEVAGIIIDESLGYQFTFTIEEDDITTIKHGTEVIITQNFSEISAIITSISTQNADETYTITAKVEEGSTNEGSANASINISEQEYEACVPSTALRQDNKGSFVYGVEERNTILGIQNVVYRIDVTIGESNNGITSITGGLYRGDSIISYSDKAINSGDRVRINS